MENMLSFAFDGRQIRVLMMIDQPWWVAKDVCEVFGDTNYRRSVSRLDDDEKGVSPLSTPGGTQQMTVVNEPGLYTLLFNMQPQNRAVLPDGAFEQRVDALKRFKRWVTHEVLPSIRKTGAYQVSGARFQVPQTYAEALRLAADQSELIERQEAAIALMAPDAEYAQRALLAKGSMTTSELAKGLGLRSAIQLNKYLHQFQVVFKRGDRWHLYANHCGQGYTEERTALVDHGDDQEVAHSYLVWTQRGRRFVYDLLRSNGIAVRDPDEERE